MTKRHHRRHDGETSNILGVVVAIAAAVFVLLIYSNIVELLPRMAVIGPATARLVIYSAFAAGVIATVIYAARSPPRSVLAWVLVAYAVVLAGIIALHITVFGVGVGVAIKSFVAGIFQIAGIGFVLGLRPSRSPVNRSVMLVLAITVVFCAVDVVWGIFTEIPGRGAGLYFNPNTAALALLLGGLGIVPALPPSARLPVAAFLALGLLTTLSRSGLLIGLFIVLASAKPIYGDFRRYGAAYRVGAWRGAIVLAIGFAYLTAAYFSPSSFSGKLAWAQTHIVGSPIRDAENLDADRVRKESALPTMGDSTPRDCSSWTVVLYGLHKAQSCPWLDPQFIDRQEYFNSGAARIIFALRGVAAIFDAPWLGSGLDRAFDLRPHNTYVLFGIAFGVMGLLFVPAFCVFVALRMGLRNGLPAIVFVISASLFSHDIFLSRDLVAGLAIVLSAGERAWEA